VPKATTWNVWRAEVVTTNLVAGVNQPSKLVQDAQHTLGRRHGPVGSASTEVTIGEESYDFATRVADEADRVAHDSGE
jgi:hypothetical protein